MPGFPMQACLGLWIAVSLATSTANGQVAGNSHVFPQIADGGPADGLRYASLFWIMNLGDTATCTLRLYGLNPDRLTSSPAITVPRGRWAVASTRGVEPLATGYGRLDCSQPVNASLTYSLYTPTGTTIGMATVFSAPLSSYAMHPLLLGGGARYGVAIANDNDAPAVLNLIYTDANFDSRSNARTLQIPPRSQYVRFADEALTLPADGAGTLEIQAVGTGAGSFHLTTLLFKGATFTTLLTGCDPIARDNFESRPYQALVEVGWSARGPQQRSLRCLHS